MVILRHVHLRNLTPYNHASYIQEILVSRLLRYKGRLSSPSSQLQPPPSAAPPPPAATILTFSPYPIYTTGRRETTPPSPSQLEFLKQPLQTAHGLQTPEFAPALRGGQITFHGPGQLVIYPIFSLSHPYSFSPALSSSSCTTTSSASRASPATSSSLPSNSRKTLSPRAYVHLLESCTVSTLAHYGLQGIRTENPGVWVDQDTKIAALGVHLRRNVTGYGVGLNVATDLRWFRRIVACGLEGKGVTSMREEVIKAKGAYSGEAVGEAGDGDGEMGVEEVADVWVRMFARDCGLGMEDVVKVTQDDILAEGEMEGD